MLCFGEYTQYTRIRTIYSRTLMLLLLARRFAIILSCLARLIGMIAEHAVAPGGPPHAAAHAPRPRRRPPPTPARRPVSFAVGLLFNVSPNLDVLAGESYLAS